MTEIRKITGIVPTNKAAVEAAFAGIEPQAVACCNWPEQFPYAPEVSFRMFHTGDEDDRDLSRVGLSLEMFRAYTEGYLSQRAKQLTDSEIDHLAFSARYITFEQVLRFLMDYIDGDTYYKVKYPGHNLVRTHAQYRLLQSMEEHYGEMCRIVRETVDKYRKA